jgi:hypothetical protein
MTQDREDVVVQRIASLVSCQLHSYSYRWYIGHVWYPRICDLPAMNW